ncbi:zinc-binding dehydrogenase [Mycobacterium aquaticum]
MSAGAAGQLEVNIAQRLPLTRLEEAVSLSESHRMTGKLILYPSGRVS